MSVITAVRPLVVCRPMHRLGASGQSPRWRLLVHVDYFQMAEDSIRTSDAISNGIRPGRRHSPANDYHQTPLPMDLTLCGNLSTKEAHG